MRFDNSLPPYSAFLLIILFQKAGVQCQGITCYRCDTDVYRSVGRDATRCEDPFGYHALDGAKPGGDVTIQEEQIHILDCSACYKMKAVDDEGIQHIKRECVVDSELTGPDNVIATSMNTCIPDDTMGWSGLVCYCNTTNLCNTASSNLVGPNIYSSPFLLPLLLMSLTSLIVALVPLV